MAQLPNGYTALEYVTTDSSAYLNTGISGGNANLEITIIFKVTNYVQYGNILGNYIDESHSAWRVILARNQRNLYGCASSIAGSSQSISYQYSKKNTLRIWNGGYDINGTAGTITTTTGTANSNNICLGNIRVDNPSTNKNIGLEIYYFKVEDGSNNTTLMELFPCKNSNNEIGFYDSVSNTFKKSSSSNDFGGKVLTQISWEDGSGDNIYLAADEFNGSQNVLVSSDINTGVARTKNVIFTNGALSQTLTVNQKAANDLSNYVQNGLVLHLDGINKGSNSSRWTSLVGSTYYTLTSNSTSEPNAIVMNGSGYLTATSPVSVTYTTGTIEVCAQMLNSSSCAIIYGPKNSIGFMVGASGYTFGVVASGSNLNNQWDLTKASLFTVSMNSTFCCLNGTLTGTVASNTWAVGTKHTLGGRDSGNNKYYANARIYSIRIYNRKLTEAEMMQNQRVDNARFNLGLTM